MDFVFLYFKAIISLIEMKYDMFDKFMTSDEIFTSFLNENGTLMLKRQNKYISNNLLEAKRRVFQHSEKEYITYCVESNVCNSIVGNKLMKYYHDIDFAVIYKYTDTLSTKFSLRSTDEHTDVCEIAQLFGGKGHRNASGCTIEGIHTKLCSIS